jgi:drug/metabolite transporter (DMT)-like permease
LSQFNSNSFITGIACGVGAGALWGLVFLFPALISAFTPLELTIGRYLAYGAIASILILPHKRRLAGKLTSQMWWVLMWLALTGNTLYYVLLSSAVQFGSIAMTSLVIGFLPVAVTIIGSRDRNAVALTRLIPSLIYCAISAICIAWQALGVPSSRTIVAQVIGLLCAIGALIS